MKGRFVEEIYTEDEMDDAKRSTRMVGLVFCVVAIAVLLGVAIVLAQ